MIKKIYILLLLFISVTAFSQTERAVSKTLSIKVRVIDQATRNSVKDAEVAVNGQRFYYSNTQSNYAIKANVGDELVVSHKNFKTVYYTIKNNEDIKVEVTKELQNQPRKLKTFSSKAITSKYAQYLDSVKFYKTNDIEKSLSFIEKMLISGSSKSKQATTYKELADVYLHWKQYDLAIENYKTSLGQYNNLSVWLQLAKTQLLAKKLNASQQSFETVLRESRDNYQQLIAYEGLGDVFKAQKKYTNAQNNYGKALEIAKKSSVTPKITDLNSKLAELYAAKGNNQIAYGYYQNSLKLASEENKTRSLKEKQKVADFYNKSQRYDEEIKLRKESLEEAEETTLDAVPASVENDDMLLDSITSQKINYKIGNAYMQKQAYSEAIPYLKKSIEDADKNADLLIKKNATKRLSEVYETVGDYTKALKTFQDYVTLVDTLYARKEQEIQQVKQFNTRILDNQNRIASLEKEKELSETKISLAYKDQQLVHESNKRQQWAIYSLIAGFLLMLLLVYFMFRTNKQQKLANNLLALKSMRSQMNPHFIFNALNSVNSFIAVNDERSANRYLSEFSVLMRNVLENSDEDFIPLSKEIELLKLYVKLEHNRFKDKFDYKVTIDDDIPLDEYTIPPMVLQPYIENAIWHGLRYKKEKGNLNISMINQSTKTIKILIEDNGIGRQKSIEMKTKNQLKQKSKGMSNIKKRIAILNDMYQDKISVTISDAHNNGSGTKVELLLKKD